MTNVSNQMVFNYNERLLEEDEELFTQMAHLFTKYKERDGVSKEKWLLRIRNSTLTTVSNVEEYYNHNLPSQVSYIL